MTENIILIGMTGAGKTMVGNLLAQKTKKSFIDTDEYIYEKKKMSPRDIVKNEGEQAFLKIQKKLITKIKIRDMIVSTGGSIIYNEEIMEYLKSNGNIVYLKNSLSVLSNRLDNDRLLVRNEMDSFEALYFERLPLYEKYADLIINCDNKDINSIADEIIYKFLL